jgi:hypothetical protein
MTIMKGCAFVILSHISAGLIFAIKARAYLFCGVQIRAPLGKALPGKITLGWK